MEKQRRKAEVSKADKTNKGKEVLPVWEDRAKCNCFVSNTNWRISLTKTIEKRVPTFTVRYGKPHVK
jgi:hypothetical protein